MTWSKESLAHSGSTLGVLRSRTCLNDLLVQSTEHGRARSGVALTGGLFSGIHSQAYRSWRQGPARTAVHNSSRRTHPSTRLEASSTCCTATLRGTSRARSAANAAPVAVRCDLLTNPSYICATHCNSCCVHCPLKVRRQALERVLQRIRTALHSASAD